MAESVPIILSMPERALIAQSASQEPSQQPLPLQAPAFVEIPTDSTPTDYTATSPTDAISPTQKYADGKPELPPLPFERSEKQNTGPQGLRRTLTASTKRLSLSTLRSKRAVQYGKGKYAGMELVPQPSDDPEDPLNWPVWKKTLSLVALLYMVAIIGVAKTIFVSVNSLVAMEQNVSYTAVVGLTAVPLMVSASTGFVSLIIARIVGKRPVYLASTLLIFVGTVWNVFVLGSFAQNMVARVFQGFGWGAFDTLVLGSIQDMYFAHELKSMTMFYNVVSVLATWGGPLIGGAVSSSSAVWELQFKVLASFLTVGTLLIAFGAPETVFERTLFWRSSPLTPRLDNKPRLSFSVNAVKDYLSQMKPWSYRVPYMTNELLLEAPKAMITPTTALLFVATIFAHVAFWGFASSLSLVFTPLPFALSPASVGELLTAPFVVFTLVGVTLAAPFVTKRYTPSLHASILVFSALLAAAGMWGFGLYVQASIRTSADASQRAFGSFRSTKMTINFPLASLLLGFLAAGIALGDSTIRPVIERSAGFTSSSEVAALHSAADMQAGLTCWRNLILGVFILGVPNAIGGTFDFSGLKAVAIGLGVTHIVVSTVIALIWWFWEEKIWRYDLEVMSFGRRSSAKKQGSFFDAD